MWYWLLPGIVGGRTGHNFLVLCYQHSTRPRRTGILCIWYHDPSMLPLRRLYRDGTKGRRGIGDLVSPVLLTSPCPQEISLRLHSSFSCQPSPTPAAPVRFSWAWLAALQLARGRSPPCPSLILISVRYHRRVQPQGQRGICWFFILFFNVMWKPATSQISRPFTLSGGSTFVIQADDSGPVTLRMKVWPSPVLNS